jgi:hypothetical protein
MRKLLFMICVLGISCSSRAQSKLADWENLNTIHAGDKIQVREVNSTKVTGTFLDVSDVAISLQSGGTSQSVPKQEVDTVKLMKKKHRLRNTLITAGVVAGISAGIGAAAHQPCSSTQTFCLDIGGRGLPAAIDGAIGLAVGAAIGALLLPSKQTVYSLHAR